MAFVNLAKVLHATSCLLRQQMNEPILVCVARQTVTLTPAQAMHCGGRSPSLLITNHDADASPHAVYTKNPNPAICEWKPPSIGLFSLLDWGKNVTSL